MTARSHCAHGFHCRTSQSFLCYGGDHDNITLCHHWRKVALVLPASMPYERRIEISRVSSAVEFKILSNLPEALADTEQHIESLHYFVDKACEENATSTLSETTCRPGRHHWLDEGQVSRSRILVRDRET